MEDRIDGAAAQPHAFVCQAHGFDRPMGLADAAESLTLRALWAVPLAQWVPEPTWAACAATCRSRSSLLHTRHCLQSLALQLPEDLDACLASAARRRLWCRLCLGAYSFREGEESGDSQASHASSYERLAATSSKADAEISRDIDRTFPGEFSPGSTETLFRVLRAVSERLEDVGYCQGMNFVAGILVRVFGTGAAQELLAYQCMLSIMMRHGMNQYFGDRFPKLRLTALQFDCLVEAFLPDLSAALDQFNLSAEFYATQWFLTLFTYSLPFPHVLRVWDQFLCRGMKFIHRVGLALLQEARPKLLALGFEDMVQHLRSLGQELAMTPSALVASALKFKITNQLLCDLEGALSFQNHVGTGRDAMPRCFRERDLDTGHTRWRIIQPQVSSPPLSPRLATSKDKASPPKISSPRLHPASTEATFLEDLLPEPRIPCDPNASMLGHPINEPDPATVAEAIGSGPSTHATPAFRQRLKRSLMKPLRRRHRQPSVDHIAGKNEAPVDVLVQAQMATPEAKSRGAWSRSTSLPGTLPHRRRPPPMHCDTLPDEDVEQSTPAELCDQDIPAHLKPFAIKDLDTGKWIVLDEPVATAIDAGEGVPSKGSTSGKQSANSRPRLWPIRSRRGKKSNRASQGEAPGEELHDATDDLLLLTMAGTVNGHVAASRRSDDSQHA